jgi:hypothetical protein
MRWVRSRRGMVSAVLVALVVALILTAVRVLPAFANGGGGPLGA